MQIEIRQALMRNFLFEVTKESKIINKVTQKKIGYELKGDLSHMDRFLIRQILEDIHPQINMYIRNG